MVFERLSISVFSCWFVAEDPGLQAPGGAICGSQETFDCGAEPVVLVESLRLVNDGSVLVDDKM